MRTEINFDYQGLNYTCECEYNVHKFAERISTDFENATSYQIKIVNLDIIELYFINEDGDPVFISDTEKYHDLITSTIKNQY